MSLSNQKPISNSSIRFINHKKIYQAHMLGQPPFYYEAHNPTDAKKRAAAILAAIGYPKADIDDDKKWEYRPLPIAHPTGRKIHDSSLNCGDRGKLPVDKRSHINDLQG